VFKIVLLVW